MEKIKFDFSFRYFMSGILVILLLNYSTFSGLLGSSEGPGVESQEAGLTVYTVELGDISNSIEVVGEAELVDEQELSFNKTGTITAVYFDAGDSVKQGDIIAEIDNSDAYDDIQEAVLDLEDAQINLNELYEEEDESKIMEAENDIVTTLNSYNNAITELENLKISQENTMSNLEAQIENAELELENLINENEDDYQNTTSDKSTTIETTEDTLIEYFEDIESIVDEADKIMGVSSENKDENDDFEDYLGVKNTTVKNKAKQSLLESMSLVESLEESLDAYSYTGNSDELTSILEQYIEVFDSLYETTDLIYETLENSIASSGSLTDSEIESMKSDMSSDRDSAISKASSITNSINNINTLTDTDLILDSDELEIKKQELDIEELEQEYEEKVREYTLEIKEQEETIADKLVDYEVAQLSLEELLEGPTDDDVTKAQNDITKAQIKLEAAYEDLEDYWLEAPFDGTVTKIDYMVGDNITDDTDKYIYIENPDLLEISVSLDQIDIMSVEIGQEAVITFDTYSTTPVKAVIDGIDTTPSESSGVVYYEVILVLDDETFTETILSGMTADVEILTESKTDVFIVKSTAISEIDGKNYVTVQDGPETKQVEVETGISSGGMTEIISGLDEGDQVIVETIIFSSDEEEDTSTSLFGTSTMGGPPGR